MRNMIWCSVMAISLLAVGGCKKKEGDTEGARAEVAKAEEGVVHERADVAKQTQQLGQATSDLAKARIDLQQAIDERVTKLDAKITVLEAKTDAMSREAAVRFRARRDEAKARLTEISTTADDQWTSFSVKVNTSWDQLEKDVDAALK